jgi:hypothetical protein
LPCNATLNISSSPPWQQGQTLTFTISVSPYNTNGFTSSCKVNSWKLFAPTGWVSPASDSNAITYTIPYNVLGNNMFQGLVNVTETVTAPDGSVSSSSYGVNTQIIFGYINPVPITTTTQLTTSTPTTTSTTPICKIVDFSVPSTAYEGEENLTATITVSCPVSIETLNNLGISIATGISTLSGNPYPTRIQLCNKVSINNNQAVFSCNFNADTIYLGNNTINAYLYEFPTGTPSYTNPNSGEPYNNRVDSVSATIYITLPPPPPETLPTSTTTTPTTTTSTTTTTTKPTTSSPTTTTSKNSYIIGGALGLATLGIILLTRETSKQIS